MFGGKKFCVCAKWMNPSLNNFRREKVNTHSFHAAMIMVVFPCGPFLQASVKIKNTWKGGGEGSKPASKCVFKVKYIIFIV